MACVNTGHLRYQLGSISLVDLTFLSFQARRAARVSRKRVLYLPLTLSSDDKGLVRSGFRRDQTADSEPTDGEGRYRTSASVRDHPGPVSTATALLSTAESGIILLHGLFTLARTSSSNLAGRAHDWCKANQASFYGRVPAVWHNTAVPVT